MLRLWAFWGRRTAATEVLAPARGRFHGGCAPHSLFVLDKKRMRRARWKRKNRLGALRCSGPPRATGVGVSVQAPILPGLRARLGLLRVCNCRPVADGAEGVGVQGRI